eukprot:gene27794-34569_t
MKPESENTFSETHNTLNIDLIDPEIQYTHNSGEIHRVKSLKKEPPQTKSHDPTAPPPQKVTAAPKSSFVTMDQARAFLLQGDVSELSEDQDDDIETFDDLPKSSMQQLEAVAVPKYLAVNWTKFLEDFTDRLTMLPLQSTMELNCSKTTVSCNNPALFEMALLEAVLALSVGLVTLDYMSLPINAFLQVIGDMMSDALGGL